MSRTTLFAARATALLATLLAATGALLLAGCSPAQRTLVTVGSQIVSADDFVSAARGADAQYPEPPEFARMHLVQDLVRRAVVLEMAHRSGFDTSQVVVNTDRDNERHLLVQTLFDRLAPKVQRVSEAEVRALYEARKQEAEVWMIYTSSRESSLSALARLKAGEPFSRVAQSLRQPGVIPPDGHMGMVPPGAMPDAQLDGAVRNQPVGEVGGPFESREGYYLIKITQRRSSQQGTWEASRTAIEDIAHQRKYRAVVDRAYRSLKAEWQMQLAPGGSQMLFHVTSPIDPYKPTPEQRSMPLATYAGGVYTLEDALHDMQDASLQRPPAQQLPGIEIWIEQQAMTRVFELEARRRHLHEEPEVALPLRRKREDLLLEGVHQLAVAKVPPPGPEQVNALWEQYKNQFTRITEVRFANVVLPDTGMIMKLVRQARTSPSLADAATAIDPSLSVHETVVHYPTADPGWNGMAAVFKQLQPGAWYGPEQVGSGWRVIQMLNKNVVQQTFEELPPATQQNFVSAAAEEARDARFTFFTDSLTTAYGQTIDHKLLAKLPWPVKPSLDVGR